MESSQVWRTEIEALMAVKDYTKAFNIAENAPLKEIRLHLLAVIARVYKEQNVLPTGDLIDEIKVLYDQINPANLGDKAIDIAADLFYSCPDLAIKLIENTAGTDNEENNFDMAFTKFTLTALNTGSSISNSNDILEIIRTRIKDPRLRSFTASIIDREQTAKEIINNAINLKEPIDRLHLLRHWILENNKRPDAFEAIECCLDILIRTTSYVPNARIYREIASPLPHIEQHEIAKRILNIFDSQKDTVKHCGPTEDFIRLQLLLSKTEIKYEKSKCFNRLLEVYYYINDIDDLAIKLSCLAWLIQCLQEIDPNGKLDTKDKIKVTSLDDFEQDVTTLLQNTANHFDITKNIIKALTLINQQHAYNFIFELNTVARRDLGFFTLIDTALDLPLKKIDYTIIIKAEKQIIDYEIRDEVIVEIIECFSNEKDNINFAIQQLQKYFWLIDKIVDSKGKCRALCLADSLLFKSDNNKILNLRSKCLEYINKTWQQIDVSWVKIDIGFKIVKAFAKYDNNNAQQYLNKIKEERNKTTFKTFLTEFTYQTCIKLAIRAFAGQLYRNCDSEQDFDRLRILIEKIPTLNKRIKLWKQLALRYFKYERSDHGKKIVTKFIQPLLNMIENEADYIKCIVAIAPVLYLTHCDTAIETFKELPQPYRDNSFASTIYFILRKCDYKESYEEHNFGYDINYHEIMDGYN